LNGKGIERRRFGTENVTWREEEEKKSVGEKTDRKGKRYGGGNAGAPLVVSKHGVSRERGGGEPFAFALGKRRFKRRDRSMEIETPSLTSDVGTMQYYLLSVNGRVRGVDIALGILDSSGRISGASDASGDLEQAGDS